MNSHFSHHSSFTQVLGTFRSIRQVLAIAVLMRLASACCAGEETAATALIPSAEIGAKATKDYQGDAIDIMETKEGAHLRAGFQKLACTVTRECLWLDSTDVEGGRLQFIVCYIGRADLLTNLPAASDS